MRSEPPTLLIVLSEEQSATLRTRLPREVIARPTPPAWPRRLGWIAALMAASALAGFMAWPYLTTLDLQGLLP